MNMSDVEQCIGQCREHLDLAASGTHEIGNLCLALSQLVEAVDIMHNHVQRMGDLLGKLSTARVLSDPAYRLDK